MLINHYYLQNTIPKPLKIPSLEPDSNLYYYEPLKPNDIHTEIYQLFFGSNNEKIFPGANKRNFNINSLLHDGVSPSEESGINKHANLLSPCSSLKALEEEKTYIIPKNFIPCKKLSKKLHQFEMDSYQTSESIYNFTDEINLKPVERLVQRKNNFDPRYRDSETIDKNISSPVTKYITEVDYVNLKISKDNYCVNDIKAHSSHYIPLDEVDKMFNGNQNMLDTHRKINGYCSENIFVNIENDKLIVNISNGPQIVNKHYDSIENGDGVTPTCILSHINDYTGLKIKNEFNFKKNRYSIDEILKTTEANKINIFSRTNERVYSSIPFSNISPFNNKGNKKKHNFNKGPLGSLFTTFKATNRKLQSNIYNNYVPEINYSYPYLFPSVLPRHSKKMLNPYQAFIANESFVPSSLYGSHTHSIHQSPLYDNLWKSNNIPINFNDSLVSSMFTSEDLKRLNLSQSASNSLYSCTTSNLSTIPHSIETSEDKSTKKRGSKIQFFNDWRLERDKCGRFTKHNNYTSHRKELLEKLRNGITLKCELCGQTFHSLKGYIDHENKLPCMKRSTGSGKKRGRPRKVGGIMILARDMKKIVKNSERMKYHQNSKPHIIGESYCYLGSQGNYMHNSVTNVNANCNEHKYFPCNPQRHFPFYPNWFPYFMYNTSHPNENLFQHWPTYYPRSLYHKNISNSCNYNPIKTHAEFIHTPGWRSSSSVLHSSQN